MDVSGSVDPRGDGDGVCSDRALFDEASGIRCPERGDDCADGGLAFEPPDALDRVLEISAVMGSFLAERAMWVDELWRDALADAAAFGADAPGIVERSVRLELAAALRITENAAGDLLRRSVALATWYSDVLDALRCARVTERHADVLVDALEEIGSEHRQRVLPGALALAQAQPVGAFRRSLRRLIDTVLAPSLPARHEQALEGRRVVVANAEDGMAWLSAYLPAVEAHAIHGRLTAIGKALKAERAETRSLDQLRADVFGDLLIDGDTAAHPKTARGIQATVAVTVPVLSLLDDEAAATAPAVVEGVGPVPIRTARELCGGARGWMRVLTHPETGVVLSVGRESYRPPASLRRFVQWRAGRCMAPGCGVPAHRCEIDHTIAWEHGGPTAAGNNAPLCKGHHTVKHHGRWKVRQLDGGVLEWTSPTGRIYLVEPERRAPAFAPDADARAVTAAASATAPF